MIYKHVSLVSGVNDKKELIPNEELLRLEKEFQENPKPDLRITHDPTLPPVGQVVACYTEKLSDGRVQLITISEHYEKYELIDFHGALLIKYFSGEYSSPFMFDEVAPDKINISVERINFKSDKKYEEFYSELDKFDSIYEKIDLTLNEKIPDPQILLTFTKQIIGLIPEIGDKILDKLTEISIEKTLSFFKYVIVKYFKYAIPRKNGIAYVFKLPGNPHIEFAAKVKDIDNLLSVLTLESFKPHVINAKQLAKELNAIKIQFILKKGGWKLNFLLTKKGEIIGTEESFSNRNNKIIKIKKNSLLESKNKR